MKEERKSWKCPRCKTSITDYPAISRRDNKTEICSKCGAEEAMFDFARSKSKASKREIDDERSWLTK